MVTKKFFSIHKTVIKFYRLQNENHTKQTTKVSQIRKAIEKYTFWIDMFYAKTEQTYKELRKKLFLKEPRQGK